MEWLLLRNFIALLTCIFCNCQAVVTLQDTQIELHKALLQDEPGSKSLPLRGPLQQEHNRHLEKHRGELASLEKLQHQLQHEKQRWERECSQKEREYEEMEGMLQERQRECQNQEHVLEEEREELGQKLQEYQQNVERLNEGQRVVENKRQQIFLKHRLLSNARQHSMPVLIPRTKTEVASLLGLNDNQLGHVVNCRCYTHPYVYFIGTLKGSLYLHLLCSWISGQAADVLTV